MNRFYYSFISRFSHCLAAALCFVQLALYAKMPVQYPPDGELDTFNYSTYWPIVDEIVQHMSLEQKIGQMTLPPIGLLQDDLGTFNSGLIKTYSLGALLTPGNEAPDGKGGVETSLFKVSNFVNATMENYQKLAHDLNSQMVEVEWLEHGKEKKVHIPILLGTDAIHGSQHILGSVLFPHNIGLAAAHDPDLLMLSAYWTAYNTLKSGFNWIFSPTTNIALNYQWGRTYETLGVDPDDVQINSAFFVRGLQQVNVKEGTISGVLATTKHYIGLGTTIQGADEGDVMCPTNYHGFLRNCWPEFKGGLVAHTGSIMCAYNAIENIPMSINELFLNQILKHGKYTGMPYDGFVVSDYEGVSKAASQRLPTTSSRMRYSKAVLAAVQSGMDMFMISPDGPHKTIKGFQNIVKHLVDSGKLPLSRINDAVRRILAVKYAMGLIHKDLVTGHWTSNVRPQFSKIEEIGSDDQPGHCALKLAEESLVLLKNEKELVPVDPAGLKYIVLLGQRTIPIRSDDVGTIQPTLFQDFNNIGAQNGGWSIRWQGFEGNDFWLGDLKTSSRATSLLDGLTALLQKYPHIQLLYPHYTTTSDFSIIEQENELFFASLEHIQDFSVENTLIITTLAEPPYAEYMGDVNISYCQNNDSDRKHGCLYNHHLNGYMPKQQASTLAIHWDAFSEKIIQLLKQKIQNVAVLSILFSGRPMVITESSSDNSISAPLPMSDAFIAAWLPGTTGGEALANAIFGEYLFRSRERANTLPVDWIKNMSQLDNFPIFDSHTMPKIKDPLFSVGYGLATNPKP